LDWHSNTKIASFGVYSYLKLGQIGCFGFTKKKRVNRITSLVDPSNVE